jgi:hypothetical protein
VAKGKGRGQRPHEAGATAPAPLLESDLDVLDVLTKAAAEIGVHPALIYAMRKTSRIVTIENEHLIPKRELDAWNAACAEGHRLLATKH